MNSLDGADNLFFRSLATRSDDGRLPAHLADVIAACKLAGYDLVVVETPGIGQGDAAIVPFCDVSLYVMTPEYGAASQLEKIDMLDFADVVADQQVRAPRRRGRPARRGPPARAQPQAFGVAVGADAGLRHQRRPLQRRRRHRAVPAR